MSEASFKSWTLVWTAEQITRFWDWYAAHPVLGAEYFSKSVAHSILDEVERSVELKGVLVELGAGPGFVTEHLLTRNVGVHALDSSPASVDALRRRLGDHPKLLGVAVSSATIPLPDASADVVLLIETIEHLESHQIESLLGEVRRTLRSGAHLVITTPHAEVLAENETMCPSCGCVFHRMQHLQSWRVSDLVSLTIRSGFRTVECKATYFSPHRGIHRALERLRRRVEHSPKPHLLYIGQRE